MRAEFVGGIVLALVAGGVRADLTRENGRHEVALSLERRSASRGGTRIFRALQTSLLLVVRPFDALASASGCSTAELLCFARSHLGGAIRRYVGPLRHRKAGVLANGMAVRRGRAGRARARRGAGGEHCYARNAIPGVPLHGLQHAARPHARSVRGARGAPVAAGGRRRLHGPLQRPRRPGSATSSPSSTPGGRRIGSRSARRPVRCAGAPGRGWYDGRHRQRVPAALQSYRGARTGRHKIVGDIDDINTLNNYVGMARIDPRDYLAVLVTYFAAFALVRFHYTLYEFGHSLKPDAMIEVEPFTPVMFGTQQIAGITTSTTPQAATWRIGVFAVGVWILTIGHAVRGLRVPSAAD